LNIRPTPPSIVPVTSTPPQPTTHAAANIQPLPAAVPKPQPAASMPSSRVEKPESRIHIGRVEVQVNNRPPAGPPPKSTPSAPPASNSMAPRFLERFLLRP
jgi:hypothetical protein